MTPDMHKERTYIIIENKAQQKKPGPANPKDRNRKQPAAHSLQKYHFGEKQ